MLSWPLGLFLIWLFNFKFLLQNLLSASKHLKRPLAWKEFRPLGKRPHYPSILVFGFTVAICIKASRFPASLAVCHFGIEPNSVQLYLSFFLFAMNDKTKTKLRPKLCRN